MSWLGGSHVLRVLLASVALLLPAGVLSAAVVDPPPSTAAAGGADPAPSTVPDDTTTTTTTATAVPTTASPSTVATTATTRRPSTVTTPTTAKAATAPSVASTRPPIRTIPTTPNTPPATSWAASANGVSARVRIEPASPNAGQPVRFVIDVSSAEDCCIILVRFGDGAATATNLTEVCSGAEELEPGASTFETDHVYGAPGAYRANIVIDAGGPCPQSAPPGGRVGTTDVNIAACFAVGPAPAGQEGCRP